MKKNLLTLSLLLLCFFSKAQYIYTGGCIDSSLIQISFYCPGTIQPTNYAPVCGCNGKTYRNYCTAQNMGGVTTYQSGICGNFDIDFQPNPIIPNSIDNGFGVLSIYSNYADAYALIQIYDVYGRVWFVNQQEVTNSASSSIYTLDIYMDIFPRGIYYLFVTINGEFKIKKIMKANLH